MLGSALYFPHIDVRDPVWLRSTLLFWDDIHTIAPSAIEQPYVHDDTLACAEAGLVRPLRCDMYPDLIDDIGRKVVRALDRRSSFSRAMGHVDQRVSPTQSSDNLLRHMAHELDDGLTELTGMHPSHVPPEIRELAARYGLARMHHGKMPPHLRSAMRMFEMSRMHPEKLPHVLRELLDRDYLEDSDGQWLLVNNQFASAYMAALATKLSHQLSLSPLTSDDASNGLAFRFLFDDVIDGSSNNVSGAVLNLTMRSINVDASVPIGNIIRFKNARRDQYAEFKAQLIELSEVLENSKELEGEELIAKAQNIYEQKIERGLRQLKREMDLSFIDSAWSGAFNATTVSASSTTAIAYFSGLNGPALLGAAVSISAVSVGVKHYLSGRKLRNSNPYSYLHDIRENFGLPDFN